MTDESEDPLTKRLHAPDLKVVAPPGLEARIRSDIARARMTRTWLPAFDMAGLSRWLAVPTAGLAALLAVAIMMPDVTAARFADHERVVAGSDLTQVAGADRDTLKPWFVQRVAYAPPVLAGTEAGCQLLGGRVADIARTKTAALSYRCSGHVVTVYVEPSTKGAAAPVAQARGDYHMVSWRGAKLACQAVSDLDQARLLRLARFIQAHAAEA